MKKGFTLIEMLVSVALFVVVVVASTVAILSAIDANQKAQSLNSVMTNLDVALESMSREIRVGDNFSCVTPSSSGIAGQCETISFTSGLDPYVGDAITYTISPTDGDVTRTVSAGASEQVTAAEVHVTGGYFEIYSSPTTQSKVFMAVQGYAEAKTLTKSSFYIETLMSQRTLTDEL